MTPAREEVFSRSRISPRIAMLCRMVPEGAAVADIGCDHGYIALTLLQAGQPFVWASDIIGPSLAKARARLSKYISSGRAEAVLSDGLAALPADKTDCAVAAGLGGAVIRRIISDKKARMIKRWVLQPQKNARELRRYLQSSGFVITDEALCRQNGRIYEAIAAEPGEPAPLDVLQAELGPVNIINGGPLLRELAEKRLREAIKESRSGSEDALLAAKALQSFLEGDGTCL